MTSSEVQRLWNDAVVSYEAATGTKLNSLPSIANASDILNALQTQGTRFEAFRHSKSKVDKIRSTLGETLYFVDQLSKMLTPALSSTFAPAPGIFAAVGILIQTVNKVSADYDSITEFFEDVHTYLEQLQVLEPHIAGSTELQAVTVKIFAAVLEFCGVCTKHVQMRRRLKTWRTLLHGEDANLAEAKKKFRRACDNEQQTIGKLNYHLLEQNKNDHAMTRAAVDDLGLSSKQLVVNTTSLTQATRSMQLHFQEQKIASERETTLNNLSLLKFLGKQQDIFAKYRDGTYDWVVSHPDFEAWLRDGTSGVLWCSGKRRAGTGKTVVTSFTANFVDEHTRSKAAAVAYVYCDYKNPETYSETGLLSSIARQFAEQLKSIPAAVTDFCEQNFGRLRAATATKWVDLIKKLSLLFGSRYLFVDALDEFPEQSRKDFIANLLELSSSIAIFITSHPDLELGTKFARCCQIEIMATKSAIMTYLEYEIPRRSTLCGYIAKDPSLKDDIIGTIQKSANGMFLLVSAQLEYLSSQVSLKQTRTALSTLPNGVSEYYAQVFQQIESQVQHERVLAQKAISYVQYARRPLTISELVQALTLRFDTENLDETDFSSRSYILARCKRLLHFNETDQTVVLVHGTLNKYLNEQPQHLFPDFKVTFARICLTALMLEPFRSGFSRDLCDFEQKLCRYSFWAYACRYWFYHVSEHQTDQLIQDPLLVFLNSKRMLAACVQTLYTSPLNATDWHERFPRNFGKAHMTARCGLYDTFLLCVSSSNIHHRDSMGMTPLLLAAQFGYVTIVEASIGKGAEINAYNVDGETALILAAKNGHIHIVQLLLSLGADIDMEDSGGWTGLDWAALTGNTTLVQQFLKASCSHILSDDKVRRVLFLAAEEGHAQIVQTVLDHKVDVNMRDALGSTALDWAVPAGRLASTRALLDNGASIDCKDNYGNTVLHWAIQDGDMIELLISRGAEVDARNGNGQTSLCWTAQDGTISAAQRLLQHGADVDARDADGFRPLHRAVLRGRMDMAVLLLSQGAKPDMEGDKFWTPLRVALVKGHTDIAHSLATRIADAAAVSTTVTAHLADRDTRAYFNTCLAEKAQASTVLTGLRAAIQEDQFERVKVMLEKGADVNAHDTGGWTALMIALWSGNIPLMQLLLEKGAKIDDVGWDEQTVLHWAVRGGDEADVQFLIEHSASVDVNAFGQSPAMLAAKNGKTSITALLIANGANPLQADYHQRTLLHWAAKYSDTSLLRILLSRGADVNATDRWGRTVLMWALETDGDLLLDYQRLAVMKLLLENGATITAQAQYRITVLHLAAYVGSVPIIQCLLDAHTSTETKTQWCDNCVWWNSELDVADIDDTKYNAVRLLVSKRSDGLTALDIAHEVGMFAAEYLLKKHIGLS